MPRKKKSQRGSKRSPTIPRGGLTMKIEVKLTELEELILESLSRKSRTTEQIRYYLEGKGTIVSSYTISRLMMGLVRLGIVTRKRRSRVYEYKLNSAD